VKRADRKARTRQALVDAAVVEFGRDGYRGARVERIAEAAGVTTGALYAHFRSKEDLYLAVYEATTARIADQLAALAGVVGEPTESGDDGGPTAGPSPIDPAGLERAAQQDRRQPRDLAGAADAWLAWHAADPHRFRLYVEFLLTVPDHPEIQADVVVRRRALRERLARMLVAVAERRGRRLTVPPEELALLVHALGLGMVLEQIGDPDAAGGGRLGRWVEAIVTNYTEEDA
jgi:AcrR family transcriptional regulator